MAAFFPRDFRQVYPTVAKARGIYIWDTHGKRYIDAVGGAVVVGIGHGVRSVARAVSDQMKNVSFAHTSQFGSKAAADLARAVVRFAGKPFRRGRVYFCTGGSEAIETAVKLARAYHLERGESSRHVVVSRTHSYHGATLGCLNYGGHLLRRNSYEPMLDEAGAFTKKIPAPYCYRCPWNLERGSCDVPCAAELEKAIEEIGADRISAFVAEPISGATFAAGVPSDRYWPRVRQICNRHGILLITDEVMTGFGRTGARFALDHWGVSADLVAMGKGIASGYLPLAGVLVQERIWRAFDRGSGRFEHGFTYHGHPVSCAAGSAVLRVLAEKKLVSHANRLSRHLRDGLLELKERFPVIGDIRGLGLMWGLEFVQDPASKQPFPKEVRFAARFCAAAFRKGLIVYPGSGFLENGAGDHVMLAPPLVVTRRQINAILKILDDALSAMVKVVRSRR